jgi:hypothetical protein
MNIEDVKTMLNLTDEEIHQEYINKTKEASTKMFKEEIEKLDSQPHPYFHKNENMKKVVNDAFENGWECCQTMFLELFNIQLKPKHAQVFADKIVNEIKKATGNE